MDAVLLSPPRSSPAVPAPAAAAPSGGLVSLIADSVSRFLAAARSPSPDLSAFKSVFSRLLQSDPNPPLEVTWFFAAVSFHDSGAAGPAQLLQLITALGANTGAEKSISLLAPVVAEIYYLTVTAGSSKVKKDVEDLLEAVVSYISICCGNRTGRDERLLPTFEEVVKVWCVRPLGGKSGLDAVFPLVGDEARATLRKEGCGVAYLAAVVIAEAFLLRLCLKVKGGVGAARVELQKELRIWAVSSITAFHNHLFLDIVLQLLLENQRLPIAMLLNTEDEILVRDVLYDALILVDYSFVSRAVAIDRDDDSVMTTHVRILIASHEAVRVARNNGDHARAMSYINAFSTSSIPSNIVNWVVSQVGLDSKNRPASSTPQAFMKWLIELDTKGMRVFGEGTTQLLQKLIYDVVSVNQDNAMVDSVSKKADAELFFVDKQCGSAEEDLEAEDMEMMDKAFTAAAQTMRSGDNGERKRKGLAGNGGSAVKYVKHFASYSVKISGAATDGLSSGSEVDNPHSDDEMQEAE